MDVNIKYSLVCNTDDIYTPYIQNISGKPQSDSDFSTEATGPPPARIPPYENGHGYHMAWFDSCQNLLLISPNFWNIIQNLYFYGDSVETIINLRNTF